jgi:hypothetical protein
MIEAELKIRVGLNGSGLLGPSGSVHLERGASIALPYI